MRLEKTDALLFLGSAIITGTLSAGLSVSVPSQNRYCYRPGDRDSEQRARNNNNNNKQTRKAKSCDGNGNGGRIKVNPAVKLHKRLYFIELLSNTKPLGQRVVFLYGAQKRLLLPRGVLIGSEWILAPPSARYNWRSAPHADALRTTNTRVFAASRKRTASQQASSNLDARRHKSFPGRFIFFFLSYFSFCRFIKYICRPLKIQRVSTATSSITR